MVCPAPNEIKSQFELIEFDSTEEKESLNVDTGLGVNGIAKLPSCGVVVQIGSGCAFPLQSLPPIKTGRVIPKAFPIEINP
jgi:hypothetical protein